MKINKRGSMIFGITIGIFIYIMGVLMLPFIIDDIDTARDALNCSDSTITDGNKINCLITDTTIPYFILFFVSLLLGFVAGSIK